MIDSVRPDGNAFFPGKTVKCVPAHTLTVAELIKIVIMIFREPLDKTALLILIHRAHGPIDGVINFPLVFLIGAGSNVWLTV